MFKFFNFNWRVWEIDLDFSKSKQKKLIKKTFQKQADVIKDDTQAPRRYQNISVQKILLNELRTGTQGTCLTRSHYIYLCSRRRVTFLPKVINGKKSLVPDCNTLPYRKGKYFPEKKCQKNAHRL